MFNQNGGRGPRGGMAWRPAQNQFKPQNNQLGDRNRDRNRRDRMPPNQPRFPPQNGYVIHNPNDKNTQRNPNIPQQQKQTQNTVNQKSAQSTPNQKSAQSTPNQKPAQTTPNQKTAQPTPNQTPQQTTPNTKPAPSTPNQGAVQASNAKTGQLPQNQNNRNQNQVTTAKNNPLQSTPNQKPTPHFQNVVSQQKQTVGNTPKNTTPMTRQDTSSNAKMNNARTFPNIPTQSPAKISQLEDPTGNDEDNSTNTKLFIATVKEGITDEEFRELFTKFGKVTNSFLHKTKWFGLITFETHDQAEAARKHYLTSNILKLKWAQDMNKETPLILNQDQATTRKESSSKCRLFIGNLNTGVTEENLRKLAEPFGAIVELYVRPNKTFAFVRYETRANAEAAKAVLDGMTFCGKPMEVRFASQGAVLKVRNLSPFVSNELLSQAFEPFGELERATVLADERGKSLSEGILEFSKKPVALAVLRKAQQECLLLTSSPLPVIIEPMEIRDDEEGFNEKMVNKHTYPKEREKGPRFAEKGSFEYDFSMKWKELLALEKRKLRQLDVEFNSEKDRLLGEMDLLKYDYELETLKRKLVTLEGQKQEYDNKRVAAERMSREREETLRKARREIAMKQSEILGYTFVDESGPGGPGQFGGQQNPGNGSFGGPPQDQMSFGGPPMAGRPPNGPPQNPSGAPPQNPNMHLFSGHPVADAVIEAALIAPSKETGKPSAAAEDFLKNWNTFTQGGAPPPPPAENAGGEKAPEATQRGKPMGPKFNNNRSQPAYSSYMGQAPVNRKRTSDPMNNMNDKRKRV